MLINKLRSRGLTGRKKKKDEGFTLVELLVVITILGILAAVVIAALSGIGDKGKAAAQESDIDTVSVQMEAYCAAKQGGTFEDPLILQRKGFAGSQPGFTDVDVDKSRGECGKETDDATGAVVKEGASFTAWQPKASYKDAQGAAASEFITGCGGHRQEFKQKPTRALIMDPQMDQIMIALGLEKDALIYGAVPSDAIPAQYRVEHTENITMPGGNMVTTLVTMPPSMQYVSQASFLSTGTAAATKFDAILSTYRAQWSTAAGASGFTEQDLINTFGIVNPLGIYNGFAAGGCESDFKADNTAAGIARTALEGVLRDVRNIGIIFDVQEEAAALIKEIRASAAANLNKAGDAEGTTVALLSGTTSTTTFTKYVGNHGFTGLVNLAGGVNAFGDEFAPNGRASNTPWSQMVAKDPKLLVILSANYNPTTHKLDCNYDPPVDPVTGVDSPATFAAAAANTAIAALPAWIAGNYVCGSYYQILGSSIWSTELIETMANKLAAM